jgi:hypothetical protein
MFDPFDLTRGRSSLFGLDVYTPPQIPKIQLGDAAPVSDQCRREFNAWLVTMFGYRESLLPKGMAYMFGNKLVIRPEDLVRIQNFT